MTDIFGISSAIRGVVEVYFRCARRTGRTSVLLDTVKSGDTVVFHTKENAHLFSVECRDRGIERVSTMVISVSAPEAVFFFPTTEGRLIFDHVWLEEHYRLQIQQIDQRLGHIVSQASGYGEPHRETAMRAESMRRWL